MVVRTIGEGSSQLNRIDKESVTTVTVMTIEYGGSLIAVPPLFTARRPYHTVPGFEAQRASLHEADLSGANLSRALIRLASLIGANLSGAGLHKRTSQGRGSPRQTSPIRTSLRRST